MAKHKKLFHEFLSIILVVSIIAGVLIFPQPKTAQAATYTFTQASWAGGASASEANHTNNRDGQTPWTYYASSTGISAGANVQVSQSTYSFTDDGATSTTSGIATGGGFGNGTNSSTAVSGSGTGASVRLSQEPNDYDLMIGELSGISYAYENTGTPSSPAWTVKSAWNAPDVGSRSHPAFADLDNDGDYDLMIGEYSTGVSYGYENTGTPSSPAWTAKSAWNVAMGVANTLIVPTFADLDNDGDYDLLTGRTDGISYAYENTGTPSSPAWTAKSAWNTPDVGIAAAPASADLDNDGDYDLMIGGSVGFTYAYQNTGTVSSPVWTAQSSWNTSDTGDWVKPALADLDNDGDYDLMIGRDLGDSRGYKNTGSITSPVWTTAESTFGAPDVGSNSSPALSNFGTLYYSSGTFTSASIDMGASASFNTLSASTTVPSQTIGTCTSSTGAISGCPIGIQLATSNASSGPWTYYGPDGQTSTYYNASTTNPSWTIWSGHNNNRYIRYQATLQTANTAYTPSLDRLTINYPQYNTSGELWSSKYDAGDDVNLVSAIGWTETATSTNETVKIQIKTASSSAGLDSAVWCGYEDCSGTSYFGDNASENNVSVASGHPIRNGANDRWFQYKVILASAGGATATVDDVVVTYVVNAAPSISSLSATQIATSTNWGRVLISYQAKDVDTDQGSPANQGNATPSFEYQLTATSSWIAISTSTLQYDFDGDAIDDFNDSLTNGRQTITVASTTYKALWNPQTDGPAGVYSTSAQIRVTLNDNEAANNIASSTRNFILDTKLPTASITIDSSGTSDTITYNFSDDSNIEYRLSNNPLTSESYTAANASSTTASTTWTLSGSTASETVYFSVRDIYNNVTSTSDTAPGTPTNFYFKDISNPSTGDYREFLSWGLYQATSSAAFGSYQIYRSTDGTNYSSLTTIIDSATNYYTDNNVSSSTTYYYKVRFADSDSDIGNYNTPISDKPDGQGGTDLTAPTISNVSSTIVQSTWAKIIWTTDEIATSTVEYSTQAANNYASSTTVGSFVTSHEVTITGLTPNTAYVYRVKSTDPAGTSATASGYSFTTAGGPVVTSVSCSATDNTAVITWNTNTDSNSVVDYSVYSNLASYQTASAGMVGTLSGNYYQHTVNLSNLTSNTTYYYRVKSTDASSNESILDNSGSYYTCPTTQDTKAPTISNITTPVRTDTAIVVMWETDESANSQIVFDSVSRASTDNYASSSDLSSTYTKLHTRIMDNLIKETQYYYKVKSRDANNNLSSSAEQIATSTAAQITVIVYVGTGGGGSGSQDTTPPDISDIKVSEIGAFDATIDFNTNESVTAFIDYGETASYGLNTGSSEFKTSHTIKLSGLKMGSEYHFKIRAIDKFGNVGSSADQTFSTQYFAEALKDLITLERASQFQEAIEKSIESILPSILPPFIEKPQVSDIAEDSAVIKWKTNVAAYSVVVYSPEDQYDSSKTNPYTGETSQTTEKVTSHEIQLIGLSANTQYHFMVKSFALPQVVGKSGDMTFITKAPKIKPRVVDIDKDAITIVWTTEESASSIVEYKNLRTGEIDRKTREERVIDHNVKIENLAPDTSYEIKAMGYSEKGNLIEAGEPITAKTSRDVKPPEISNLRIDGALVPGRTDRVQTVIGWRTDEPATSIVEYEEGSGRADAELANKVANTDTYVQNHTVIVTTLKPGALYRIKVASVDDAGNKTASPVRTIITPRQAESIVDVVVKNFEETFQFLKKLR